MAAIIESIRAWVASCPLLKDGAIISVDNLGADPVEYTVDTVPCDPIVIPYVDGSSQRQFLFVFASREYYSDTIQNITNSEFYDLFSAWVETQNREESLPQLEEYRYPLSVEIVTSGYPYDTGSKTARYQIQLRFTYYQDRRYTNG